MRHIDSDDFGEAWERKLIIAAASAEEEGKKQCGRSPTKLEEKGFCTWRTLRGRGGERRKGSARAPRYLNEIKREWSVLAGMIPTKKGEGKNLKIVYAREGR